MNYYCAVYTVKCTQNLRTMNASGHINSVPWLYAVTPFIQGTELMRLGKVTLRSTKISIKWLWPVKVTLEVIKRRVQ